MAQELKLPDFVGGLPSALNEIDVPEIDIPNLPNHAPSFPGGQVPAITGKYTQPPVNPIEFATALKHHIENPQAYAQDKYAYGKNYAYSQDYTGQKFERFYNVPRVFNKVGFSPWRDNEALYKTEMTWFDDWKRAAVQSTHLAQTGFKSMLPQNVWNSDIIDEKSAAEMEKFHMIGQSSLGGIGGFLNNLTVDAGYTMGVTLEFAGEELATLGVMALAAPFTEGLSIPVGAAKMMKDANKAKDLLGMLPFYHRAKTLSSELNALRSINTTRKIFEYTKAGKPLKSIASLLLPSGTAFTLDAVKGSKNVMNLASLSRGAGAFYRDAREIAMAISESKLEAGAQEKRQRDELTDLFFQEKGYMPNSEEMQDINQRATNSAKADFTGNVPVLWITNKIVFDTMFAGLPLMKNLRGKTASIGGYTYGRTVVGGKSVWKGVEENLLESAKKLTKRATWNPSTIVKTGLHGGLLYTVKNLSEALQEGYQDALSSSITDYYNAQYSDPLNASLKEPYSYFVKRMGEQFTTPEGRTTLASGFFMGALVQFPQHIIYKTAPDLAHKVFDQKGFNNLQIQREQQKTDLETALNTITNDPEKFFDPFIQNLLVQKGLAKQMSEAVEVGDTKGYMDTKKDAETHHLITLLESGHISLIEDMLNDYKSLSGPELEQAMRKLEPSEGDSKQFFDAKIDGMLNAIKYLKNKNEFIEDKFPNEFNPHKYSSSKDPDNFRRELINWQAFQGIKRELLMNMTHFDDILSRMTKISGKLVQSNKFKDVTAHDFNILLSPSAIEFEISRLKDEINTIDQSDSQGKKEVAEKIKKKEIIEKFRDGIKQFKLGQESKNQDTIDRSTELLKESYKEYLQVLTKDNIHTHPGVDSSFEELLDYYLLDLDKTHLAPKIDALLDPKIFVANAERLAAIFDNLFEKKHIFYKKSVDEDYKIKDTNALLKKIYEEAIIIDEKGIEDIKNFKQPHLIDVLSRGMKPVEVKKGEKVRKLIEEFFELHKAEKPAGTEEKPSEAGKPNGYIKNEDPKITEFRLDGKIYQGISETDKGTPVVFLKDGEPITMEEYLAARDAMETPGKKPLVTPTEVPPEEPIEEKVDPARAKNEEVIKHRIELLREKLNLLDSDTISTNNKLQQLDAELNNSLDLTENEIDNINLKIEEMENLLRDENFFFTKKGKIRQKAEDTQAKIDKYKNIVKQQFDRLERIARSTKELQAELIRIEEIKKDLLKQSSYYHSLISDKSLKVLNRKDITDRIDKIEKKIGTVEKLINILKDAIRKSVNYIKDYLNIWKESDRKLSQLTGGENFKELNVKEINELFSESSPRGQDYLKLRAEFKKLENDILYNIDNVEFHEEVKSLEEKRLSQLQDRLKDFKDNVRYLKDLLKPMGGEIKTNPLPKAPDPKAPVPVKPDVKAVQERLDNAKKETPPVVPVPKVDNKFIDEVNEKLKVLDEKDWEEDPSDHNFYINLKNPGKPDVKAERRPRVSTMKVFDGPQGGEAATRGTVIDDTMREVLGRPTTAEELQKLYDANPKKGETLPFTPDFLEDIASIFNAVTELLGDANMTPLTRVKTLWGEINWNGEEREFAGTMDVLGVKIDGRLFLIDLKTSVKDRRLDYEITKRIKELAPDLYESIKAKIKSDRFKDAMMGEFTSAEQAVVDQVMKEFPEGTGEYNGKPTYPVYFISDDDSIQLSSYAEMLRQRTGLSVAGLLTFPVRVYKNDAKTAYTKAVANTDKTGKYALGVPIRRDIYPELPSAPGTPVTSTPAPEIKITVTDEDRKLLITKYKFTISEVDPKVGFGEEQLLEILANGWDRNEYLNKREARIALIAEQKSKAAITSFNIFRDAILSSKKYSTLMQVQDRIVGDMKNLTSMGIKMEELNDLIKDKIKRFVTSPTFADIQVDDFIVMNTAKAEIMKVYEKDEKTKTLKLKPVNDPEALYQYVKEEVVDARIKYKLIKGVSIVDNAAELTKEQIANINETTDDMADIAKGTIPDGTLDDMIEQDEESRKDCKNETNL